MARLERGLLLQLNTWHSDVWAEIIKVDEDESGELAYFARYDLMGNKRWVEVARQADIRCTCHTMLLEPKVKRTGALYLGSGRQGLYSRQWAQSLHSFNLPTRARPEVFQPDVHSIRYLASA